MSRRARLTACAAAVAGSAALAIPAAAQAHGLVGRQDLPIPRWLFAWGAAVVLVASFVALAVLWREPRLEGAGERRVLRVPALLEVLAGVLGVAAFVVVVWAGLAGTQTATANLAPTTIYVIFWVGIPILSLLLGDVFRALQPLAGGRPRGALGRGARPRRHACPSRCRTPRGWAAGPPRRASSSSPGSSSSPPAATTRARWPSSRSSTRRCSSWA